ncbi:MAG: 4-hydroxy-tetrahydrodipicolinate reductase, partial [Actinomycetota bacterium]
MTKVGVLGAAGKVGRLVCRAVAEDSELRLVAGIDPPHAGEPIGAMVGLSGVTLKVSDDLMTLVQAEAEVVVDFTQPDQVLENVRWAIDRGIHVVVGTTGVGPDEQERIRSWIEAEGGESNVIVAPNFSIGAVVAERLAEQAARYFPAVEIVELHHDQKLDAPSGTASAAASRIASAREEAWSGPSGDERVAGVRGGEVDSIRVHSIRLPGLVAHHEFLFGGPGQMLTIRHDTMDRASFVPGVLLAIREVVKRPGLTVGLEPLLGLD